MDGAEDGHPVLEVNVLVQVQESMAAGMFW
jgi:hypothetical protein